MKYIFNAEAETLLAVRKLEPVISNKGEVLPLLKNPETGKIVVAKGVSNSSEIGTMIEITKAVVDVAQPLISTTEIVANMVAQMLEKKQGYTATLNSLTFIENTLEVLQSTTALIDIATAIGDAGTTAGVVLEALQSTTAVIDFGGAVAATATATALTAAPGAAVNPVAGMAVLTADMTLQAVNLRQTLKLREDVKQLRLKVKDGFLESIQRLDEVSKDIKFNQHRVEFIKAYTRFVEASRLMRIAVSIENLSTRSGELANVRQTLAEAVSIYNNPHLLEETSAAGYLRRMECAWAIEQAIVLTYQLQKETAATSDRLSYLQDKIRQDSLAVIDRCETEAELDFLFPEIATIHNHDLAVLETWKNQIDWMRSLSPSEQKMLANADFSNSEVAENSDTNTAAITQEKLPEELLYEQLKEKSHPASLKTQLRFLIKPELRQEYESSISQQAAAAGYKTLVPSNLEMASNMTVANLFYYFQFRGEYQEELEEEAVMVEKEE